MTILNPSILLEVIILEEKNCGTKMNGFCTFNNLPKKAILQEIIMDVLLDLIKVKVEWVDNN